jgi:hypothetical protein
MRTGAQRERIRNDKIYICGTTLNSSLQQPRYPSSRVLNALSRPKMCRVCRSLACGTAVEFGGRVCLCAVRVPIDLPCGQGLT